MSSGPGIRALRTFGVGLYHLSHGLQLLLYSFPDDLQGLHTWSISAFTQTSKKYSVAFHLELNVYGTINIAALLQLSYISAGHLETEPALLAQDVVLSSTYQDFWTR